MRQVFVFYLLFVINSIRTDDVSPLSPFSNRIVLIRPDVYVLYWNNTNTSLTGEIHVKTTGWVGFGLSPNGGMNGSDVFVAWINSNGTTNFTDRHIIDRSVLIDKHQDWFLLKSTKKDGYIIIQFTRKIHTCDPNGEDLDIEPGTPRVIFAYNSTVPTDDIFYHGPNNRNSASIPLLGALNQEPAYNSNENITMYDFHVNNTISNASETFYYCKMFKLPEEVIERKRHLVRYETLTQPGNEIMIHHWIAYQCSNSFQNEYLSKHSMPKEGSCFDANNTDTLQMQSNEWYNASRYCRQIFLGWAVGGNLIVDFPENLAMPIGGEDAEFQYFYLEIHYHNPLLLSNFHDTSGMRMYLTTNLSRTEMGIYTLGAQVSWTSLLIPPKAQDFKFDFLCTKDCLDKFYNNSNVTVIAHLPHTHLTGVQVYTKIIRDEKEVGYLAKALNYDFNYQYLNYLQTPIVLHEGDELRTTCVYDTLQRDNYTYGGYGTPQEMCFDFLLYYPRRPNFGSCLLQYEKNDWLKLLEQFNSTGDIELSGGNMTFDSLTSDIKTLKASLQITEQLRLFFETANQTQTCVYRNVFEITNHSQRNTTTFVEKSVCD